MKREKLDAFNGKRWKEKKTDARMEIKWKEKKTDAGIGKSENRMGKVKKYKKIWQKLGKEYLQTAILII